MQRLQVGAAATAAAPINLQLVGSHIESTSSVVHAQSSCSTCAA